MRKLLGLVLLGFNLFYLGLSGASSLLESAREISVGLDDPTSQIINLVEIASLHARQGDSAAALSLAEKVQTVTEGMEDVEMAVRITAELAAVYRLLDRQPEAEQSMERALAMLAGLDDDAERPWVLSWLSGCAARAGLFELAETIKGRILNPLAVAEATGFIAVAKAEAGLVSEALSTLAEIADANGRGWALADLLESLARKGGADEEQLSALFDQIDLTAGEVDDPYGRATVRLRAGRSAKALGQEARAVAWLAKARDDIAAIGEYYWQIESLSLLAQLQAELGEKDAALQSLREAEASAERLTVPAARSWNQAEVAVAYARIGEQARAEEILEALEWLTAQSWVLTEIALAEARTGNFTVAIDRAQSIRVPFWRAKALIELARLSAE